MPDPEKKIPEKRPETDVPKPEGEEAEESPKRKRMERSGKMSEDALKPFAEARQEALDQIVHEEGELSERMTGFSTGAERKPVPVGWFFLLGFALAGVLIWMVVQIYSGDRLKDGQNGGSGGGSEELWDDQSQVTAEKDFLAMKEVVTKFLEAGTVEERAQFVRHPERVIPLMEDHHRRNDFETYSFDRIEEFRPYALALRPFRVLSVRTEEDEQLPVLLEDSPEGPLVDWESFICYQPMSPEAYLEKRPLEPVTLRAYGTVDHFYVYEFSDEKKWGCLRLDFRDSDVELFGYVKKGSETDQKLKQFASQGGKLMRQPLIVRLRFLEDSREKRCVLIEDIDSFLWAYPEDPASDEGAEGS